MTCTTAPLSPAAAASAPSATSSSALRTGFRLSPRTAFFLQASMTLGFLAGSSAPTPLYALYQAQWGFSSTMLTVVFGIYAIAVLAALLVVGRLSDHIGRRPVLIAAALAQAVAMVIFATATGLHDLLFGRVLQGLSAGAAVAAVGAGLLDIDKVRGAVANSFAPMTGTALGGVMAALMVMYLPAPTHLVYAVLGVVFVAQALAVVFIDETAQRHAGATASLVPQMSVPADVRGAVLRAVPALVAVWALAGFYGSLGPTLVRTLVGSGSVLLGGLSIFILAGSGAVSVLVFNKAGATTLTRLGAVSLLAGLALSFMALVMHSITLFLIGTAVAGSGFGTGFQGALRSVVTRIGPQDRAGVLSVLFVVSYLAMGAPAIWAGWHLAHHGDIAWTAREYGAGVMVLAALAFAGTLQFKSAAPRIG